MSPWVWPLVGAGAGVLLWFAAAMAGVLTRAGAPAWPAWVPGAGAWVACRRAALSGWWVVVTAAPVVIGAAVLAAAGAFSGTGDRVTAGRLAVTAVGGLLVTVGCCAAVALWGVVAFRLGRLLGWSGAAVLLAVLAPPIWASLVGWGPRAAGAVPGGPADPDGSEPRLMMRVWAPPGAREIEVPSAREPEVPAAREPEVLAARELEAPTAREPEVVPPPPVRPVVVAAPVSVPVVVAPVAAGPVVVAAPATGPAVVVPPAANPVVAAPLVPAAASAVAPTVGRPFAPTPVSPTATPFAAVPSLPPPPPPVSRPGPESMAWSHPGAPPPAPGSDESTRLAPRRREVWWLVTATQRLPLPLGIVTVGRVRSGVTAGSEARVSHGGAVIGLDDPSRTVSKRHAQLRFDGSAWWISDAGSTNGTALLGPGGHETVVPVGRELVVTGRVMLGDLELQIMPAGDE